jgi:hypothetical protein
MRKLVFAAAVAAGVGLSAADARAQFSGPPVHEMTGPGPGCEGGGCGKDGCHYGLHPLLKKLLWWKKDDGCGKGGKCGKGCDVPPPPGAPGGPQVGTLVFPQHPFVRSPRDYFMYGQGGY